MRAIVLEDSGVRFDPLRPDPRTASHETLVRASLAGICETDLQLIRGYMGFRGVLGHEFVGVAVSGRWQGQRVVGEINCSCGLCADCRNGLRNHCSKRSVLGILNHDGAFAELVAVPQENLHLVPDSLPDEVAVFAEPVAAAYQIPVQIPLRPGLETVVLGDGRLGNLCAQVLRAAGCRVTVVGKHSRKMSILAALGLDVVPLSDAQEQRIADLVVDCTGSPTGLPLALRLVRPRGTVVLKTTVVGEQTLALAPIVIDEVTIVGSRCGPFDRALVALASGEIDVSRLVDGIVPLEQGADALARAATEPVLKLLLKM